MAHVWALFIDLNNRRRAGFSGPEPISDQDIRAWQQNFRTELAPWEIRTVYDLDTLFRASRNDRSSDT